ncbi:Lipoprotein OS=Stutzerimonas stutzeri OX=316 GN=CXK95_16765 PE=4 SV=1 [Stutzerimonas stutzeri]
MLAWSHSLGEQNARWLSNREHWQRELLDAMRQRNQADFAARIARLLQDREALLGEADRAALQHAERAALALLADLHGMADARQREHLAQRLQQMREDLAGLECLPASAAAARA